MFANDLFSELYLMVTMFGGYGQNHDSFDICYHFYVMEVMRKF